MAKWPLRVRVTIFLAYVVLIFSLLPFGRAIAIEIRHHGVLSNGVYALTGAIVLIFFVNVRQAWKRSPVYAIVLACSILAATISMFFTLNLPEERLHFVEYGFLGYLCGWMLSSNGAQYIPWRKKAPGFLLAFSIGLMDEIVQGILPMRVFDLHDIFWNTVSSWLGLWTYYAGKQ